MERLASFSKTRLIWSLMSRSRKERCSGTPIWQTIRHSWMQQNPSRENWAANLKGRRSWYLGISRQRPQKTAIWWLLHWMSSSRWRCSFQRSSWSCLRMVARNLRSISPLKYRQDDIIRSQRIAMAPIFFRRSDKLGWKRWRRIFLWM